MATIKTIEVRYGRKFNLGDYNSANIEISIWAEMGEDDDPEFVRDTLFDDAKAAVKAQAAPLFRKQTARAQEIFAGMPVELQQEITNHGN